MGCKVTMYVEKVRHSTSSVHGDVRNSLAKAFRSADCRDTAATVHQVRNRDSPPVDNAKALFARSTGKRFAQGIYDWCRGETQRAARSRAVKKRGLGWEG